MKCSNSAYQVGTVLALAATVVASPAHAFKILQGTDYFETTQPTSFIVPTGYPNAGVVIGMKGLPIGPGSTDTIVQRQSDCSLNFNILNDSCTIPIEMVALSLVAVNNPMLLVRESPTLASSGMMTMISNGSGTGGGTFNSFFDIFIEVSMDGGNNFILFDWDSITSGDQPLHLTSTGASWTTLEHGLLVDGLIGDQNANRHTDKVPLGNGLFGCPITPTTGEICADFYLLGGGVVTEVDVMATHTARGAVPEPATLALLGIGFAGLGALRRRNP